MGKHESATGSDGVGPAPRCVVLVGEADAVPASLVGALDRRGLDIVIVRQPPRVMAELAEASPSGSGGEKGRDTDANPGLSEAEVSGGDRREADADAPPDSPPATSDSPPAPPRLSIVIVEPQQQPRIGELRQAVASYYPTVRCWQYQAHGPEGHARLDAYPTPDLAPGTYPGTYPGTSPETAEEPDHIVEVTLPHPGQDLLDPTQDVGHTSNKPADTPKAPDHDGRSVENPDPEASSQRVEASRQALRSLVTQVPPPRHPDDGPLVTEQELAMLLGPAPVPGNNPRPAPPPFASDPPPRPTGERE